jgi:hypothetical protein
VSILTHPVLEHTVHLVCIVHIVNEYAPRVARRCRTWYRQIKPWFVNTNQKETG